MPYGLGSGAASGAAGKILKRKKQIDDAFEGTDVEAQEAPEVKAPTKTLDMSNPKAYQEYQMQQAIDAVRKKKTARRTAY